MDTGDIDLKEQAKHEINGRIPDQESPERHRFRRQARPASILIL
jgi:hypothetical protein